MRPKDLPKLPDGFWWDTSQGPRTYTIRQSGSTKHIIRFTSSIPYSYGQLVWRGEVNPSMWDKNKGDPVPSLEEGVAAMLARWRLGI